MNMYVYACMHVCMGVCMYVCKPGHISLIKITNKYTNDF